MKRFIFTIVTLLIAVTVTSAQGFFERGGSPNQNFIEEALSDAFLVVRVEFQLEDTVSHERFNIEGKSFFGFSDGLCIKTAKGWIAPTSTVTPWKNNLEVRQFPGYKPVLSTISTLSSADTVWSQVTKPSIEKAEAVPGTSYSCVPDLSAFGPGLVCSGLDEKTDGWIVWVTRSGNRISLTTYSHHVTAADSTTFGIGRKVVPEGVVGGFYVKPVYPSVGVIRFELVGLMDKGVDGWKVVPFANEVSPEKPVLAPSGKPSIVPDKPKLVPANGDQAEATESAPAKNKKSKKNKK